MPNSETQSGLDLGGAEVLTLAETAAYLRVSEQDVLELVTKKVLPAQQIGGEWRFLQQAVVEWLRCGLCCSQEVRKTATWIIAHSFWEDLFQALETRILRRMLTQEGPPAKPGSKQAILKHFGVFQDAADLEEQLAGIRDGRESRK